MRANQKWHLYVYTIPVGAKMAEALGKLLASDVFESYSAGTKLKKQINPDAVRLMKQIYGIDMEETQYNKLLSDIPKPGRSDHYGM